MQYDQSAYDGYGAGAGVFTQQGYDDAAQQELSIEEMMADEDSTAAPAESGADFGEQVLPGVNVLKNSGLTPLDISAGIKRQAVT